MSAALSIQQLSKTYGNGFVALKNISFEVQKGDFFALLGPNGAGKSTTLGIVSSLVNATSGKVEIFGHDLAEDMTAAKKFLGVVPQEFNFNAFETVYNIVRTQAGFYGMAGTLADQRSEHYLTKLGLWDKRDTPARMLSGGMKRRLMIARALVHEPKLLILDEPTAGVDIELRRSMWDFLQQINAAGTTIILTTHYLEEAEFLCKNIAIIDQGAIVQNTSIKALLQQLDSESFILDIAENLQVAPDVSDYQISLKDQHCLLVEVKKGQSLNNLFVQLEAQNISVLSMRNKSNRLEEMFISMVEKNLEAKSEQ
ncbi:MAG: putative ATP-binding component of ABC transporter [Osedax symbiont Rs2]|nr:MAG: putative ATP-binding component of ABC transporter [Osedax symbiont Rs2]